MRQWVSVDAEDCVTISMEITAAEQDFLERFVKQYTDAAEKQSGYPATIRTWEAFK